MKGSNWVGDNQNLQGLIYHLYLIDVWYIARHVVKNREQEDMRYNEIALCVQNIDSIIGSSSCTFWRRLNDDHTSGEAINI